MNPNLSSARVLIAVGLFSQSPSAGEDARFPQLSSSPFVVHGLTSSIVTSVNSDN